MEILSGFSVKVTSEEVLKRLVQMGPKAPLQNASARTKKDVEKFLTLSKVWVKPRAVYGIFPCQCKTFKVFPCWLLPNSFPWKGKLIVEEEIFSGKLLPRNFKKSSKVGFFVVTIGKELQEKASCYPESISSIIEAIGSAAVAKSARYVQRKVMEPFLKEKEGQLTTLLYPGVGDWPIEDQKIIFKLLGSEKFIKETIGVALTARSMMFPRKSISAIVGIKTRPK